MFEVSTTRFNTRCQTVSPLLNASGVGTGGSGGSMNRGPRALGAPSSWATEIFLGKTLRKIIKIVATRLRILRL